ncbi:MAG: hypothetical protein EXS46_00090 [Candidatus Taylorbacteria bacterium]|nr:hypothetical protein [Candidatus Taylorbacteria bacterium]
MLTDDQIGYLMKIGDSNPPLPEQTVKIMLTALKWSPEEIKHGVNFLNRPHLYVKPTPVSVPSPLEQTNSPKIINPVVFLKPIVIKQNPFPIGSPLFKKSLMGQKSQPHRKHLIAWGTALGVTGFFVGYLVYDKFAK